MTLITNFTWPKKNVDKCSFKTKKSKLPQWALGYQTPSPPSKTPPTLANPLKSATSPSSSLFRQSPPPLYYFFVNPAPVKIGFFSEPKTYWSFSSFPSYLLKVTKLLVKIFQFEFFFMTKKNIFIYKLFFCH